MIDNRDRQTYPFYAAKDAFLVGVPAAGAIDSSSFLGRWEMNHDGWQGELILDDLQVPWQTSPTIPISGTYTPSGGAAVLVNGELSYSNPREISFDIEFSGGAQRFHGYLLSHEQGILAGTTEWSGTSFGFVARRLGGAP
jgi:hypothetical protein